MINFTKKKQTSKMAFTGVAPHVGATSLALQVANYLHSVKGQKVIYVEVSEYSKLLDVVDGKPVIYKNSAGYKYKGISYFVSCSVREAKELLLSAECSVIVDVEKLDDERMELIQLCDKTFVIGSTNLWNIREYLEFINYKIIRKCDTKKLIFLSKKIGKKEKKCFKDAFDIAINSVDLVDDPFNLSSKDFDKIEVLCR